MAQYLEHTDNIWRCEEILLNTLNKLRCVTCYRQNRGGGVTLVNDPYFENLDLTNPLEYIHMAHMAQLDFVFIFLIVLY